METTVVFPDTGESRDEGFDLSKVKMLQEKADGRRRRLAVIVAVGRRGEIGVGGDMVWHIGPDLRRFKALTMGHPVIMGRRTWESLPAGALPGRRNIVLSRDESFSANGAERASSLEEALDMCDGGEVPFIIGGGKVYREALPMATELWLTCVEGEAAEADTYFPALDPEEWEVVGESDMQPGNDKYPPYRFVDMQRRK